MATRRSHSAATPTRFAGLLLALLWFVAPDVLAQPAKATAPAPPKPLVGRVALSRTADLRLFSVRVRRLISIELYGAVDVGERPNGTLDADLIRVWIDTPTPDRCLIEVRRSGRSLARRAIDITKLPSDIAARFVAIEAAEMMRVQARPTTEQPSEQPDAAAAMAVPAPFSLEAAAVGVWLPFGSGAVLAGSELSLEHRHQLLGQRIYGRWLLGDAGVLGPVRWAEAGLGGDVRVSLMPRLALRFGLNAGLIAATLPDASTINGDPASTTDWSASLGLLAGIEGRSHNALLGAGLTAATLLRPLNARVAETSGALQTMSLGLRLSIAAAPMGTAAAASKP